MGLMLQVISQLMNFCTIALLLALPGSSGSILQPPAVSPWTRQSARPSPEHAFPATAAAVPAQSVNGSVPPLSAETSHEQPRVSATPFSTEAPAVSSQPPAAYPSHDSARAPAPGAPPSLAPPPAMNRVETVAPLPHVHTLSSTPSVKSPSLEPPSITSAPPLAAMPPANVVPLPLAQSPQAVNISPSSNAQPFSPFSLTSTPSNSLPARTVQSPPLSTNVSTHLPQKVPPSDSPRETLPVMASPLPAVPPHASPILSPPVLANASSPLPHVTNIPSHSNLTVPIPQEPPPISLSHAMPPYVSTLRPPPGPLNASPAPPEMVRSVASPPMSVPSHALVPLPSMKPLAPEPLPISPTVHAVPPPEMGHSLPSPPRFIVPWRALVPPPLMEPLPPQPPLAISSAPHAMPPYASIVQPPPFSPYASSPPLNLVPSHPSPPNFISPPHALVPPPLGEPSPPEPPPPLLVSPSPAVPSHLLPMPYPHLPPHASPPPLPLVPSHASPPTFEVPPHSMVPHPLMMPPKDSPSVLPSTPPTMPPHASVEQSPPPPSSHEPPYELSPFPHPVAQKGSPTTVFVPPPSTRPPHAYSTPPPVELPYPYPPASTTLPGEIPPPTSSPTPMSPPIAPVTVLVPSPPLEKSHTHAPQPPAMQGTGSAVPPHVSQRKETQNQTPPSMPASLELSPPPRISPRSVPSIHVMPGSHPPNSHQIEAPNHGPPLWISNTSVPQLPPLPSPATSNSTIISGVPFAAPSTNSTISSRVPLAAPPGRAHGSISNIPAPPPLSTQVQPPITVSQSSPYHSPVKGISPPISPSTPTPTPIGLPIIAPLPAALPPNSSTGERSHSSAVSPSPSIHKQPREEIRSLGPAPVTAPPPTPLQQGSVEGPSPLSAPKTSPVAGQKNNPSSPPSQGSPMAVVPSPAPSGVPEISPVPSKIPFLSPKISPSGSSTRNTKRPLAPPIRALPPPPPNQDCAYLTCPEPYTNTPPGSPCHCVWPMQVGLRLSVALYTFFPLVSELAKQIAVGVSMNPSQVRVMGANSAGQEPDKTIVLIDLVPLHDKFDYNTAMLTSQRFWHKQVAIYKSLFGDYDVLYVRYPGLPPSPPMAPDEAAIINGMPYSVGDPNGSKLHPLGVDVPKQRHKCKLSWSLIAVIVFSAIVGMLICGLVAWFLAFRHANRDNQSAQTSRAVPSLARSSGPNGNSNRSGPSPPQSSGSSLAAYIGSAKTFSASEIEMATDNFNPSGILGEGGFGCVYRGVLEDGTSVAVKVLKRDDQQGGREFLAEVEMLGRLHHRNLVKLIGICIEEHMRCLVYELVPNGSVDSHLHGPDKETAPLDWASRLKIALGAARGLAYLHEDSSPRVIHRDFKSSNILLEIDFTPKVSDFGLARTALDEENKHISTRVMGTFGYVAPEYAMTGHLLVKSDVYSYGVVLLELLTGRKPVDMSQPPGQENLVAWTRPFLTTKEGLESIIDPSLGPDVPLDSVAKVAAIASMCVQPEVSHRPFMGEVVQALKLVCNECEDSKDGEHSRSLSRENLSIDFDCKPGPSPLGGEETLDKFQTRLSPHGFPSGHDLEKGLSVSEIFSASTRVGRLELGSLQTHSASAPVRTSRGPRFWQKLKRLSQGSVSEHGITYRSWSTSH